MVHYYLFARGIRRNSEIVNENLNRQNIEFMGRPPYIPDLVPNNVFLFLYIKNLLERDRFSAAEEAFKTFVLDLPIQE